jgi:hypothetical protein
LHARVLACSCDIAGFSLRATRRLRSPVNHPLVRCGSAGSPGPDALPAIQEARAGRAARCHSPVSHGTGHGHGQGPLVDGVPTSHRLHFARSATTSASFRCRSSTHTKINPPRRPPSLPSRACSRRTPWNTRGPQAVERSNQESSSPSVTQKCLKFVSTRSVP